MPARLVWRPQADRNLQAIFDFLVAENPRAAGAYVEDILEACDRLSSFPRSGRQYNRRYRVLVVRNHLVFYRHDAETSTVSIIAIIDGRRDVRTVLDNLPDPENPET